jgi:hypothetical protein
MALKSKPVKLNLLRNTQKTQERHIRLDSRYTLHIEEQTGIKLNLVDTQDDITLSIALTESGPVLSARGIKLDIQAAKALSFHSPDITLDAGKTLKITSRGTTHITSRDDIQMDSQADIRLTGKLIYLN